MFKAVSASELTELVWHKWLSVVRYKLVWYAMSGLDQLQDPGVQMRNIREKLATS